MTLLTEHTDSIPSSVGKEGGDNLGGGFAVLDSFLYQDMQWCVNCGGKQLFVPVDKFPSGWRGYCHGCEQVMYVVDERTNSEAA